LIHRAGATVARLATLASLATMILPTAPAHARPTAPKLSSFAHSSEALMSLLVQHPRVIAFGEFHQTKDTARARSAIAHFSDELLGLLPPRTSDLIVETWVTEGHCGKQEEAVVAQVAEGTKRPESTETEVVTLLRRAKLAGLQPHVLTLTCAEYAGLQSPTGELDYVKLLATVTELLTRKIDAVLATRAASPNRTIAVYGGALHNDLFPRKELAAYTFGARYQRKLHGKYLELDLYVPEYIDADPELTAQPWYPLYQKLPPTQTTLIRRGPASYILVFPRQPQIEGTGP
jgi:hypothetical protein